MNRRSFLGQLVRGLAAASLGAAASEAVSRALWERECMRRYTEALALDYVIPFKVVQPNYDADGFMARIRGMMANHRRSPQRWNLGAS